MKGKIKFYKANEFWGKIDAEGLRKHIYFNAKDVMPELRVLLENNYFNDEYVDFEKTNSIRREGEEKAIKVNIDFTKRKIGNIKTFDTEKGFGFIENYHSKEPIFFHYSGIRNSNAKFIKIENLEPVVYSEGENENGKIATDIVKLEFRNHLQRFAEFNDSKQAFIDLKNLAESENWDYLKKPTKTNPVLRSYLNQTIRRIQDQNKLIEGKSSKDGKEYAYFNSGLVTSQQDEIFAYFIKSHNYKELDGWGLQKPKWHFIEFNTNQSNYRRYFSSEPEIATYFSEAEITDLILDTRIPIIPDTEHLVKRKIRIESERIKNLDNEGFIEEIKDSIELAIKRIKRNYKTAIPHFYDNRIQFLLPLCFRANKAEALGALVVNKTENIYEAHTILSLDQAYNNARLLAKPDREWLNP